MACASLAKTKLRLTDKMYGTLPKEGRKALKTKQNKKKETKDVWYATKGRKEGLKNKTKKETNKNVRGKKKKKQRKKILVG